jgi:formate hydrogenlyase subunit 6/NADH:ubiquinone oxidoreductase subunit I
MHIGMMLSDILRSLLRKPATALYPAQVTDTPVRLRGVLHWDPTRCTGCCLCNKDCPSDALELITLDKANKRFVMRYDMSRCTFCAQCVQNCRFDCLSMSSDEWEMASGDKRLFTVYYGDADDVESVLAGLPQQEAERTP